MMTGSIDQALSPHLGTQPSFVPAVLEALYGLPASDRAVLLGLAPPGSGSRKDLGGSIFAHNMPVSH